ncbi:MAG: hypothetical protein JKY65_05335 [Planctomycetes bacterium]|nr:hypothetical protein [Planctomycetota bacterium]
MASNLRLSLLLIVVALATPVSAQEPWVSCGTGLPADVKALGENPLNSSQLYAGSKQGFFKSVDGGATWVASNAGLTGKALEIKTLATHPLDPNVIWLGTKVGVYKSTDGGASWVLSSGGLTGKALETKALVVDPSDPNLVYVGTKLGVYKSTDGGANWVLSSTGIPTGKAREIKSLTVDPTNPAIVYAGTKKGVYKSTDGGANWVAANTGIPDTKDAREIKAIAIDPFSPQTVYVGTKDGVYKSTNGGGSWSAASVGLATQEARDSKALVVDPLDPQILYLGTKRGVYRSVDGGASWTLSGLGSSDVKALLLQPINAFAGTKNGLFCLQRPGLKIIYSGLWSNSADWSPPGVPVPTDFVVVAGPVSMDLVTHVSRMVLINNAVLTFAAGQVLTVEARTHVQSGRLVVSGAGSALVARGLASVAIAGAIELASSGQVRLLAGAPLLVWGKFRSTSPAAALTREGAGGETDVRLYAGADLYVDGLQVSFGDLEGLDVLQGAQISRLKDCAFSGLSASPGARFLSVESQTMNLNAPGCTFAAVGLNQFNVNLTDLDGGGDVVLNLEDRGTNGAGASAALENESNTAAINWVYSAPDTTSGTALGFPQTAYDLNTFALYATYVAFKDVDGPGTVDRVYVFDPDGLGTNLGYSCDVPQNLGDIAGTLWWDTYLGQHVVWLVTTTGRLLRFVDDGASAVLDLNVAPLDGLATVSFTSSPITDSGSLLYVAGTAGATSKLYALRLLDGSIQRAVVLASPISTSLATQTAGGVVKVYAGGAGRVYRINPALSLVEAENLSPTGTVASEPFPAFGVGLFAGDSTGTVVGVDQAGLNMPSLLGWPVQPSPSPVQGSVFLDWGAATPAVYWGNDAGEVFGYQVAGATPLANYPASPMGLAPIRGAGLVDQGVLWLSNDAGLVVGVDALDPARVVTPDYRFGAGVSVPRISQEFTALRVTIANSAGKLLVLNRAVP